MSADTYTGTDEHYSDEVDSTYQHLGYMCEYGPDYSRGVASSLAACGSIAGARRRSGARGE